MMVDFNCWPFFEIILALRAICPNKGTVLPESRFPGNDGEVTAVQPKKKILENRFIKSEATSIAIDYVGGEAELCLLKPVAKKCFLCFLLR